MNQLLANIRQSLKENVDEKTLETGQNFFKEKITSYGVRIPVVNQIGKHYYSMIANKSKNEIFDICEELWRSGYLEESFMACNWAYENHERYESSDFEIFEKWINLYVDNWASCDTLCNHSVGSFIEMHPQYIPRLKKWAISSNRWVRRSAAVTLIIPARKGLFLKDILEIADLLLLDQDDLVRKGYGWMLKAASEAHQKEIFEYVLSHKAVMPRTSLRYAIEKMPPELKAEAMKKDFL